MEKSVQSVGPGLVRVQSDSYASALVRQWVLCSSPAEDSGPSPSHLAQISVGVVVIEFKKLPFENQISHKN